MSWPGPARPAHSAWFTQYQKFPYWELGIGSAVQQLQRMLPAVGLVDGFEACRAHCRKALTRAWNCVGSVWHWNWEGTGGARRRLPGGEYVVEQIRAVFPSEPACALVMSL